MSREFLETVLKESIDASCELINSTIVSGGCINNTLKLETSHGPFFIKWKPNEPELFQREAQGLEILRSHSPIHVPEVLAKGAFQAYHFLLLEYIESSPRGATFWEDFGGNLAQQHRVIRSQFGLDHDNHIGRLSQQNEFRKSWIDFFVEMRLEPQVAMAEHNRVASPALRKDFEKLYTFLPDLLPDEPPSLLHGDLWSGNFMTDMHGRACIFDPAIYYGHREMELAFTKMFGGFTSAFYKAYDEEWPLAPGFEERQDLYNLYPLLVHLNLFGSGYMAGINQTLKRFL